MFELFRIVDEENGRSIRYSFHWQDANGQLHKRWDNATHHTELPTYPNHVHNGAEENVLPHGEISAEEVLAIIATEADQ